MFRALHNCRFIVPGTLLLLSGSLLPAVADDKNDIKTEADFASGLVDLRFPDYAQKVLDKLVTRYGDAARSETSRVRLKIMTSTGDFKAAEEEIGKMPSNSVETMTMKLTLADQFYNWGKLKKARELYDEFFGKYPNGPPPELQRFYGESAYRYAQMLKRVGDYTNAIQGYRYVLLTNIEPEDLANHVKIEMCELIVQAASKMPADSVRTNMLNEAFTNATGLQWHGPQSLWFWKSVVILAHIEMIRGNKAAARKLLLTNMQGLDAMDELLRQNKESLKLSPMAECRYLMGTLCEENGRELVGKNSVDEGRKVLREALVHYCTVILKYPSSSWTAEARKRVDGIVKLSKEKGWRPEPQLPKFDNSQFAAEQLKDARLLFQNNDFQAAAEKYQEVLGIYYDRPDMVAAVGELARCYIEIETTEKNYPYYSRAIAGYVADRYCKNTNLYAEAGDTLLLIANAFETRADRESSEQVLDMYFDKYSDHKRAIGAVLHRAARALRGTNYVGALKYYKFVVEKYPNSARATDAMGFMGLCYSRLEDHTNAIVYYSNYVAKLPWSIEQAVAIRNLGDEYQQDGRVVPAINEYNRLVHLLTSRGDQIEMTQENQKRKKDLLEWSLFQKASCYSRLKIPPEKVGYYQTNAIDTYMEFIKRFPKSEEMAPRALSALGALLSTQGRPQEAEEMYRRMQTEWPTNVLTLNSAAARINALLLMGNTNDAIKAASAMLDRPDAFKPEQFYMIAGILLDASMYDEASKAFTATRRTTNTNMWQLASLGLGRALVGLGRHEEAVKPIEEMLARVRRSAYTREASLILSRCYAEIGKKEGDPAKRREWFNKSIVAVNKVIRLTDRNDKKACLDVELELATILLLKGEKNAAAATYMRMLMDGDSADPRQRPAMETAFELGTPLLLELQKYEDVKDNCRNYRKQFPGGRCIGRAQEWELRADAQLAARPR